MKFNDQPFLSSFFLVILLAICAQLATAALFVIKPQLFYYRDFEYLYWWANTTQNDDSYWDSTSTADLAQWFFFSYQEPRDTVATADSHGFRSVPAQFGEARIIVFGRSNIFGARLSDHETVPWRLAERVQVGVFNAAMGKPLRTLSKPALGNVEIVIDTMHERYLANIEDTRQFYALQGSKKLPYRAIGKNKTPFLDLMLRDNIKPNYWLPDIVKRSFWQLYQDLYDVLLNEPRPYIILEFAADNTAIEEYADIIQQRQKTFEALGYDYIAVIIPARQTILAAKDTPLATLEHTHVITAELVRREVPILNLVSEFSQMNDTALVFKFDSHWNEKGADLASQLIHEEILARYPDALTTSVEQQP